MPLGWSRSTGRLAANLEARLAGEARMPTGVLMPIPTDGGDGGEDNPLASLKTDIAGLKGKIALVETTSAGLDPAKAAALASLMGADV